MPPKKKKSKKGPKKPAKKHGTRPYQKDMDGPSWDRSKETPPDVEEMMALIERRPEDLELYRKHLVALTTDPAMKSLSMTEQMNIAEMNMLREKIMKWIMEVDTPDRLEELRESNKMLRAIWQITEKMMDKARERAPLGGDFEGLSRVLDDVEEVEDDGQSD